MAERGVGAVPGHAQMGCLSRSWARWREPRGWCSGSCTLLPRPLNLCQGGRTYLPLTILSLPSLVLRTHILCQNISPLTAFGLLLPDALISGSFLSFCVYTVPKAVYFGFLTLPSKHKSREIVPMCISAGPWLLVGKLREGLSPTEILRTLGFLETQ